MAKKSSALIYVPRYCFSEKRQITGANYLLASSRLQAKRATFGATVQGSAYDVSQIRKKHFTVYKHLSIKSRTMSRCGDNKNMRALLKYIRKKRLAGSTPELPSRHRRSFPKQSKHSSKRSRKFP